MLRVRMQDSVMKFGYACTFSGKPRGEPPAPPPAKRTSALPRLPVCRALSRQIGKCIFRAMLAALRTRRRQHLALSEHIRLQRKKHAMKLCIGPSLPRGVRRLACRGRIGPPHPNRLVSACCGASEFGSDVSNGGLLFEAEVYVPSPQLASGLLEPASRRIVASLDHFAQSDDRYHHGHDARHGHAAARASSRHSSPPASS